MISPIKQLWIQTLAIHIVRRKSNFISNEICCSSSIASLIQLRITSRLIAHLHRSMLNSITFVKNKLLDNNNSNYNSSAVPNRYPLIRLCFFVSNSSQHLNKKKLLKILSKSYEKHSRNTFSRRYHQKQKYSETPQIQRESEEQSFKNLKQIKISLKNT